MSTVQKAIRDQVVTRIQVATGLPLGSIYRAPRRDIAAADLPAVLIYSHGDKAANLDDNQQFPHERMYTLRVEVRAQGRVEEDATDNLATQIRHALLTEDTLAGLVIRTLWEQQQWDGVENDVPESGTALDFTFHYLYQPE